MSGKTILAIDQGTTSSRAILFSENGDVIAMRQKELPQHYPQKGWVEQDALDIWNDTLWACRTVLDDAKEQANQLVGIGITNQRETIIIWDRKTGEPVYNAIVWQDRRTARQCEELAAAGHEMDIRARTGLLIDPYFCATKLEWILNNVEGVRARADAGDLAFGTVDSWLLWNLTGGAVHATDTTNAARTLLFNVQNNEWDDHLLKLFNVPRSLLPEVKDNVAVFGVSDPDILGHSVTIGGMAGDQHAAVIGQACFKHGMVKSTYGTGCFALMNIGNSFQESKNRLLTTPAYRLNGQTTFAIEGSIFIAGAAIQWLRDGLKLFSDAAESEGFATSVHDNHGVYFVPAFTGLGAPYWAPNAHAAISGLTRDCTGAHITRAALEAQAYQTCDLMEAMEGDTGERPEIIRADGGLTANGFVCQFIADMLDTPLELPKNTETTAHGAAYLAGLHAGIYKDLDDIAERWQCAQRYDPHMAPDNRAKLYDGWKNAVKRVL